jgi:hypothetical protein
MTIGRTIVVVSEVHGLGDLFWRPLKCVWSPALGVELAWKLTGRHEEAGLYSGENVHMPITCLLIWYLEYRSIGRKEVSLDRASRLVEWKQLTVHLRI